MAKPVSDKSRRKLWEAKLAEKDETIANLRWQRGSLKRSIRKLRNDLNEAQQKIRHGMMERNDLRAHLNKANEKLAEYTPVHVEGKKEAAELEELYQQRDGLERENLDLQGVIARREAEIRSLRSGQKVSRRDSIAAEHTRRLERELKVTKRKLETAEAALADCRNLNSELKWAARRRDGKHLKTD